MLKAQRLDGPAFTGRAGKCVASLVVIIAVVSGGLGPVKQGQLVGVWCRYGDETHVIGSPSIPRCPRQG